MKIALIVCWYGNYPWYLPYFIYTCGYNPTIDFFIITDNTDVIPNKPDNVRIVHRTIEELKNNLNKLLGFEVVIDTPFKLCDFKPTYGLLFQDIIYSYDFWGHTDLDIVFGDIRGFMTDEVLNNHDVISARYDFTAGYFTLYRNNVKCNNLFKKSNHYKIVFQNPESFWFDEFGDFTGKNLSPDIVYSTPNMHESMTYIVKMAQKHENLRAFFDLIVIDGVPGNIKWKDGKVLYRDKYEAMFYHLIYFKKLCKSKTVLTPIPNEFYFTRDEILETL